MSARAIVVALTLCAAPAAADRTLRAQEDQVAGGTHWRIDAPAGAIHVWIPPDYDRATAGLVIYVHGYGVDADGAWHDHDLATQFRASGRNAMFVVPEAPAGKRDPVAWPALAALRRTIERAHLRLPSGSTVAIGHSGAYRTLASWIDHQRLDTLILLDAMYGAPDPFARFVSRRPRRHRLILVGADTDPAGRRLAARYRFAITLDALPADPDTVPAARTARLVSMQTDLAHMDIVTSGRVIPLVLALTALPAR